MPCMPFRARRTLPLFLLLQVAVLIIVSACGVASDHPLADLEASEPIPGYLLGAWDYAEVAGLNAEGQEGGVVFDQNANGSLRILVTERASTVEYNASLVTIGNLTILSMKPQEGEEAWLLASLAFDESAERLAVSVLGHTEVIRDVRLGIVEGEVSQFDQRERGQLSASSQQLRSYFAAHSDVWSNTIAVLRKRPS